MLHTKKISLLAIGSFVAYSSLYSQNSLTRNQLTGGLNTITTAVPFLLISPDARSGGLADAGVATTPDASSIHWNPAKLSFVEKNMGFAVSYTPWLRALVPDINLAYLSGYTKLKKGQAIGASLRYFSLGDITFTDIVGTVTGQFRPNEFALDVAYSRKLSDHFSGGLTLRYIHSNLTGGIPVAGVESHAGNSISADLSGYYETEIEVSKKKSKLAFGLTISNIGAKISYTASGNRDFIPTSMKLGSALTMNLDEYNQVAFVMDFNKLLVPTPPIYKLDSSNAPVKDLNGNPIIMSGKDPNVSIVSGIFQSFGDAPGGIKEESKEVNPSIGVEYWYAKQFAVRAGYFYEHKTKGNRKFFTIGAGLRYKVFGLDFAYLIPTEQRNPLENTLRFTLLFDFDAFSSQSNEGENITP